jgi:hypothetical protein
VIFEGGAFRAEWEYDNGNRITLVTLDGIVGVLLPAAPQPHKAIFPATNIERRTLDQRGAPFGGRGYGCSKEQRDRFCGG